jgi:hypothetical protein
MRGVFRRHFFVLILAVAAGAGPLLAQQQPPEVFHWIDFHAADGPDRDIVVWVTHSLEAEKWTAIREIGVEYDAALVVTTLRATPQSPVDADSFTVWNVSLTTHGLAPLMKGVNLRWQDWMHFAESGPMEPTVLYDNCAGCAADTYFTAFHYDAGQHMWTGRWMRGSQAVPVWGARAPDGVTWSQVYARLTDAKGTDSIGTWSHFDYGTEKPPQDFVYRYDVDPFSHLERTQLLIGKEAEAMKDRLCRAQGVGTGLARGQDSGLCKPAASAPAKAGRRPVTTPPANNRGQSQPPPARH